MKNISVPILKSPVGSEYKIAHGFGERGGLSLRSRLFHARVYRIYGGFHPAVDFKLPEGSLVFTPFDGVVVRVEKHEGMGLVLGIRNGNVLAIFGHLIGFKVSLGDVVVTGQKVALSGNTGKATHAGFFHLHFELRDLRKTMLAKMVFKPEFDQPISCWQETFMYKVNNKDVPKSLGLLAKRYMGNDGRWEDIKKVNPNLKGLDKDKIIPDGFEIIIPNFI